MPEHDTMIAFGGNLKATKNDDGTIGWVEGLGVLFGNESQKDLEGDFFTEETYFGPTNGNQSSATLNHGIPMIKADTKAADIPTLQDAAKRIFKNAIETEVIDTGILTRHALDLKDEFEAWVFEQVEAGTFKRSSGALAHLVEREDNGHLKRWEIGEFAYTPTPAEPRLPAITPLKSYQASFMGDSATDDQETEQETGGQPVDSVTVEPTQPEIKSTDEDIVMSDETQESPALTLDDIKSAFAAEIEPLKAELEAIKTKPVTDIGVAQKAATVNVVDADSMGNSYLKGFEKWLKSRGKNTEIKALEAGVDSEGGYLVAEEWEPGIAQMRESVSAIRRLPVSRRTTVHPTYRWPTESTAYAAATSTAEEAAYDQTDPAFGEAAFTITKYTRLTLVADELFDDNIVNLQAALTEMLGRAHGLAENAQLVVVLEAGTLTSQTLDSNATIAASEIPELYYLLPDGYEWNGWLMRKATEGVIRGLTGSDFHFMPNPQGDGMNLWGAPVVNASAVDAIATTTNSIFGGDWTAGVGFVERQGLSITINPYLYEANGQVGIFSRSRWDIQLLQPLAIVEGVHPV